MRLSFYVFIIWVYSVSYAFAASPEHVGLKIKNTGFLKLLNSALDNYTHGDSISDRETEVQIPNGTLEQVIEKEFFQQNPVIQKMQQFIFMNLDKDLKYNVKWSPVNIRSNISNKKVSIEGEDDKNIDIAIRFDIDNFSLWGNSIEVIEKGIRYQNGRPEGGLYGKFENFEVSLRSDSKIHAVAILKVNLKDSNASIQFAKMYSNLRKPQRQLDKDIYSKYNIPVNPPRFFVNFQNFFMPPPVLVIDGESFEIDIQKIEDVILEEKTFIAKKLVAMAGDFLANDLQKFLNESFFTKLNNVSASIKLIDFYEPYPTCEEVESSDLMNELQDLMKSMVYETKVQLDIDKLKAPLKEDLEVSFKTDLSLNEKGLKVFPYIHNNKAILGELEYSSPSNALNADYDIAFAISEPLMNTFLKAAKDNNIYQDIIDKFMPLPGVKIQGVNMHFVSVTDASNADSAIDVVLQVEVNFDKLDYKSETSSWTSWFTDTMAWSKNQIAAVLENGKVYFPLQIRIYPKLVFKNNRYVIQLNATSPLNYKGIKNHYDYPYKKMYSIVEDGIIERIKSDLVPQLKSIPEIDITPYLDMAGMQLKPIDVFVKNSGHLILRLKVKEMDLSSLIGK